MHVWAAVKKYHRRTWVGIEPTTSWLLDRRHATRPPRLPDGCGWFDSHNISRYCVEYQLRILGWVDLIVLNYFALSQHKLTPNVQCMFEPLWKNCKIIQYNQSRHLCMYSVRYEKGNQLFWIHHSIMQVSFVRRTSWPPGMVCHCTDVHHPFIYHDAPSVRNSDSPFKNIYAYLRQNYDAPNENDQPMTHIILRTPEWRSYIDEPCDAFTVKWLTKTHIWVSVVTTLLLPWRYYASSIWQYMTHHSRGSRGASYKWHLH